jgi:hypothetical protein
VEVIPAIALTVLSLMLVGAVCSMTEKLADGLVSVLTVVLVVVTAPITLPIALGAAFAYPFRAVRNEP